eukprot:Hpha_TRINITY_DN16013_c1_g6::TRINITY_DN16013_c1_g6_i1::g.118757::m.118757
MDELDLAGEPCEGSAAAAAADFAPEAARFRDNTNNNNVSAHRIDPEEDLTDFDLGRCLMRFGFSKEEAKHCVEDIPSCELFAACGPPIDWCLHWREGLLPSLQCREATVEDCAICMSDRGCFQMYCAGSCKICKDCMVEHLKVQIAEHKVRPRDMQCPSKDGGELSPECVRAALEDRHRDLYERFLALAARKAVEGWQGESVLCPRCPWAGVVLAEDQRFAVRCGNPACSLSKDPERKGYFCGHCGDRVHKGWGGLDMTCEEYAQFQNRRGALDDAAAAFGEIPVQVCPDCGTAGVLELGCKYVQCRCGCHYCFHCGRGLPIRRQHFSHFR